MAKSVNRVFQKEKETKNKIRFQEVDHDKGEIIGNIYLTKDAFADLGNPESIAVDVMPKE